MANIQLNHESVSQATEKMVQATNTMTTNMEDLVQGLQAMSSTFTGNAAEAWQQFQTAANQADEAMKNDFGQGAQRLNDMHDLQRAGDTKGAGVFSS